MTPGWQPDPDLRLLAQHADQLCGSGISRRVALARGYRSVTSARELQALGFSRTQAAHVPALLVPLHGPTGGVVGHVLRPDEPRVSRNGRPLKYETPVGARAHLDIPPVCQPSIADPAVPLFVVEGSKKADAAAGLGLCCVGLAGVWNWRGSNEQGGRTALPDWESIALNGRRVFIAFDSDAGTKPDIGNAEKRLATFLAGRGADVRILRLPSGPDGAKVGVDDYLLDHTAEELLQLEQRTAPPTTSASSAGRPEIHVEGRFMREIAADSVRALQQANGAEPYLFRRGDALVRMYGTRTLAERLGADALRGELDRVADFVTMRQGSVYPARPPQEVVRDLLSLPDIDLPELADIRTAPTYLPGGRLLREPGYDEESGVYLAPSGLDIVQEDLEPATALVRLKEELLGDFPFADPGSLAHALALLIQPFARPLIAGACPLYLIDAPARGTGKGLLADVAALLALGAPAPVMTLNRSEEELDKRIVSLLIAAAPMILVDNVTELSSSTLCAALTATRYSGRVLGVSKMVTAPNTATWLATGNNPRLSDELVRRVAPIRLDAGVERPEERRGFRHPDLMGWVRSQRTQLVSACLALVRAWVEAGMPPGTASLGRFEAWASVMGGILGVSGVPGFLGNRERLHESGDAATREWVALCSRWWEAHETLPVTAGDLLAIAKDADILLDLWGGRSQLAGVQRLGHALHRHRDRVFGAFRIRHAGSDSRTGNNAYLLERTSGRIGTTETPETRTTRVNQPQTGSKRPSDDGAKQPPLPGVSGGLDLETPAPEPAHDERTSGVSGIPGVSAPPAVPQAPVRVHEQFGSTKTVLISRIEGLSAVVSALSRATIVGIDLETTGLNPRTDRIRLLSLCTGQTVFLIDCFKVDPRPLFPQLARARLIGHNLAFDLSFLARVGFEPGPAECTMTLAQLLHADAAPRKPRGFYSLAAVAERELGVKLPKEQQTSDWTSTLTDAQKDYAARDSAVLLPLRSRLTKQITTAGLSDVAALEARCLPALVWLSMAGTPFDGAEWERLATAARAEAAALEAELNETARTHGAQPPGLDLGVGWTWTAPAIVRRVLRATGTDVTDTADATLATIDHPLVHLLRRWRAASGLAARYGDNWLSHLNGGRLYSDWRQCGAESGRMACDHPPLQQMPRDPRYRACVKAPAGRMLIKADYSQIELRIAARIAGDTRMLNAYASGQDLHSVTARLLLGREFRDDAERKTGRQLAKAINFGLIYGMGVDTLRAYARSEFGVSLSEPEAAAYREAFFRAYPGLRDWHRKQRDGEQETRTLMGRRRLKVSAFTKKLNSPVQGTGADGLKQALALLWERRGDFPGAVPVIACHDELVLECDESESTAVGEHLRRAMLDGMGPLIAPVPVDVEVKAGATWAL